MPFGIDFAIDDKSIGVCIFCYRSLFKEKCIAYGADLICPECIQKICSLAAKNGLGTVYTCKYCGESFVNHGKFLAHCRVCKKEEAEEETNKKAGLKAEVLA